MATGTLEMLEVRLTALERRMSQVQGLLEPENARQYNPWLDQIYGAFKDDPLFEEAVKYGREWRDSQNKIEVEENIVFDGHG